MAPLLALVVLLCSATIAVLLAWLDTRAWKATSALFVLSASSVVGLGVAVGELDEPSSPPAAEVALVQEATPLPTVVVEPTASPTPEPTVPAIDGALISGGALVVEPLTAEQAFASPTSFELGEDGELYVGHNTGIARAVDTTGDGFYDQVTRYALDHGWTFGLEYHEGALYAASAGSVLRITDVDGDGTADDVEELVSGLPTNLYGGHSNSGLAFGPDGLLYMTVGGTSDHGPERNPFGGTILRMDVDGGGHAAIHARGFRNPYDLAFCPDGKLYATDNGPDQLDESLTEIPPDEVNLILEGGDYGYPDDFGTVAPETGTESPIAELPYSAGTTGVLCYTGGALPDEYIGDLFVTLWGTFTSEVETGRRVMHVDLQDTPDGVRGSVSEFMADFGHPIDILQDADGNLLVLDFERGQVIKIGYESGF